MRSIFQVAAHHSLSMSEELKRQLVNMPSAWYESLTNAMYFGIRTAIRENGFSPSMRPLRGSVRRSLTSHDLHHDSWRVVLNEQNVIVGFVHGSSGMAFPAHVTTET